MSRKPRSSTFWAAMLEQSVFFEPRWPSRGPHCTLSPFLFWTGAEPTRDPVDCDHSSRPGRSPSRLMTPIPADFTKTLEVSRHLRADDFVHCELPPCFFLKFDRCHEPSMIHWAHSLLSLKGKGKTVVHIQRPLTFFCMRLAGRTVPRRLDGTVAGCDLLSHLPFSCGAPLSAKVFAHSQVRDSSGPTDACCGHALEAPSSWPSKQSDVVSRVSHFIVRQPPQ